MTTAHRPTFYNALGGEQQGGNYLVAATTRISSRDLPGYEQLKLRQPHPRPQYEDASEGGIPSEKWSSGQGRRNYFKQKLEEKEQLSSIDKRQRKHATQQLPLEAAPDILSGPFGVATESLALSFAPESDVNPFPEDSDDEGITRKPRAITSGDETESSDEDEEEALLLREWESIRRERQEEERRKQEALVKETVEETRERVLKGNPLLMQQAGVSGGLKRRWDEDVVFQNQAKDSSKPRKRFINDAVRSEFHRRFLNKYIQ